VFPQTRYLFVHPDGSLGTREARSLRLSAPIGPGIGAGIDDLFVGYVQLPNGNLAPGPKFDFKLRWFERPATRVQELLDELSHGLAPGHHAAGAHSPVNMQCYRTTNLLSGRAPIRAKKARYFKEHKLIERVIAPPKLENTTTTSSLRTTGPRLPMPKMAASAPKAAIRAPDDPASAGIRREPELVEQRVRLRQPGSYLVQSLRAPPPWGLYVQSVGSNES